MQGIQVVSLFIATAICEIVGCYLPMLHLSGKSGWWVYPVAILALGIFVWLLTLHPIASGRVYAAYGGIYIAVAIGWLWLIDGIRPSAYDLGGLGLCVLGALVIYLQPRPA